MEAKKSQPKVLAGTIYLTVAQILFLLSSYLMHIILGRHLGPVEYGLFGVVLCVVQMLRTFIDSGFPMAVSRYIASEPHRAEAIFKKGQFLQFVLAASIGLVFFLLSPALANALGDERLKFLFHISALIPVLYSGFFLTTQYYNGLRLYRVQSILLIIYYLLRVGFVLFFVYLGMKVMGAVFGLMAAAGLAWLISIVSKKKINYQETYPGLPLIHFSIPLTIAAISMALITDLDLMFVKAMVPDASSAGYYTAAKTLARAVLVFFYALAGAMYPAVSNAISNGDLERFKNYLQQANQLLLMILLPAICIVFLESSAIIQILFGEKYANSASTLEILTVAFSALSFFVVHITIINGAGFPKVSSILTFGLVPLCVLLHVTLIPSLGLAGAALSSTLTYSVGVCFSFATLYIKFKMTGIRIGPTVKIVIFSLLMFFLGLIIKDSIVVLIPRMIILVAFYFSCLYFSGELQLIRIRKKG